MASRRPRGDRPAPRRRPPDARRAPSFSTAFSVEPPVVITSSRTTTGIPVRGAVALDQALGAVVLLLLAHVERGEGRPAGSSISDTALASGQPPSSTPATAGRRKPASASNMSSPTSAWPSAVRTVCLQSMKKSLSRPEARMTFFRSNERSRSSSTSRARDRSSRCACAGRRRRPS